LTASSELPPASDFTGLFWGDEGCQSVTALLQTLMTSTPERLQFLGEWVYEQEPLSADREGGGPSV
jgi:hypothetical protein